MTQGARYQRNVLPSPVSLSLPEKPASPPEEPESPRKVTSTLSNIGPLDALTLDAPIPAPAPAHYFKEDF